VLEIVKRHSREKSPLLMVLEDIQLEFGFIPKDAAIALEKEMNIPLSRISSIITFYNDFKTEKRGLHLVRVCLGTACCVRNANTLLGAIEDELKIKSGKTTPDNKVTLETVNCFGACGLGPIIDVDGRIIGKCDEKKARAIARELMKK
ncbi:MAG: NAD(P)H-dependent oxidoreductase subunit E, partial [Candidatus Woesearchaeota archaeon]|nr:NAD(P)H-dependent oxidoreductase subunit E [Candidatus Woesearchaeota archaeon]